MSKLYKKILVANLLLVLGFFAYSVVSKERLIANSTEILLRLAPVDPRSLMQGDYMQLNYALLNQLWSKDSCDYVVVKVGSDKVAEYERVQNNTYTAPGEVLLRIRRNGRVLGSRVSFGAEQYFFQEGTGQKYENAKYGLLKVDADGNCILVGLCDSEKRLIK